MSTNNDGAEQHKALITTEDSFENDVINNKQTVVVDFWAEWCGPCVAFSPLIEKLADVYEGRAVVAKVDVDKNKLLSLKYSIRSIPTVLIFKDGEIVDRVSGAVPEKMLRDMLDKQLT